MTDYAKKRQYVMKKLNFKWFQIKPENQYIDVIIRPIHLTNKLKVQLIFSTVVTVSIFQKFVYDFVFLLLFSIVLTCPQYCSMPQNQLKTSRWVDEKRKTQEQSKKKCRQRCYAFKVHSIQMLSSAWAR